MRILTRLYILKEVTSHALIGGGGVHFRPFYPRPRDISSNWSVRNPVRPLPSVAEIFFFTVPSALTYTIPMGVLVGILIGLSRLAADSMRSAAMRASGIGVWTFLRIISIFVIMRMGARAGERDHTLPLHPRLRSDDYQDRLKGSQIFL